jgi:membrane protein implicated in regulation of membrane protease activity
MDFRCFFGYFSVVFLWFICGFPVVFPWIYTMYFLPPLVWFQWFFFLLMLLPQQFIVHRCLQQLSNEKDAGNERRLCVAMLKFVARNEHEQTQKALV